MENPNIPKDKFGDDLMIQAQTSTRGADRAALVVAWCRGIRHILTPLAWIVYSGFAYAIAKHFI